MGTPPAHFRSLLLLLLPMLALGGIAARAGEKPALAPEVGLNAFAALADQQLASARAGLRMLAVTDNAASGVWDNIRTPLAQFAKDHPASAAVWFVRPDGEYFTVEAGPTRQSLRDRPYFPTLLAGKEVAGDLVVSRSTGKRSTVIAVPVLHGSRVVGALGASISMEKVADLIDHATGFPPQVMFYALDAHGMIALHREPGLLFEFAPELGGPTLSAAVHEMLAKPEGAVRYEFQGAEREAIFKRSATSGWVYALRW